MVRRIDEAVVSIIPGVERTHAIEFAKQNGGEQVVDGKGIVRILRSNALKVLQSAVVILIVETLKSSAVQRIMRTVRAFGSRFDLIRVRISKGCEQTE